MSLDDRSRPDEGGSKTIAAVDTSIELTADTDPAAAWWKAAMAGIKTLSETKAEFDADTLLALVGQPPKGRQLSVALAVARRRHQIVPVRAIIRGSRLLRIRVGRGAE
jgi:hypothetical protein